MSWKPRFGMRFLLIAIVVCGATLGLWLKARWAPRYQTITLWGTLNDQTKYRAEILLEHDRFRGTSAQYAFIVPDRTAYGFSSAGPPQLPHGSGIELYPNGVFFQRQRIAGFGTKRAVVVLDRSDVQVIDLAEDDLKALGQMTDLETSKVWQEKIEPEVERLVTARESVRDRRYRSLRAERNAQGERANSVVRFPHEPKEVSRQRD